MCKKVFLGVSILFGMMLMLGCVSDGAWHVTSNADGIEVWVKDARINASAREMEIDYVLKNNGKKPIYRAETECSYSILFSPFKVACGEYENGEQITRSMTFEDASMQFERVMVLFGLETTPSDFDEDGVTVYEAVILRPGETLEGTVVISVPFDATRYGFWKNDEVVVRDIGCEVNKGLVTDKGVPCVLVFGYLFDEDRNKRGYVHEYRDWRLAVSKEVRLRVPPKLLEKCLSDCNEDPSEED